MLPTVAELLKAGPVAILAVLVWIEVHEMRIAVERLGQAIAVLVDRAPG
jgi:hypothetical protein